MSDLIDSVQVNISAQAQPLTVQGFGVALLLSRQSRFGGIREFTSLQGLQDLGFLPGEADYQIAAAYFGQRPAPRKLKIANLPGGPSWVARLQVRTNPGTGYQFRIAVMDATGAIREGTYTVTGLDTLATIAAGLHTSLDPLPGIATAYTVTNEYLDLSAQTGGSKLRVTYLDPNVSYLDNDPDGSYATRLGALASEDSDFYGVLIDSTSDVNVQAVATWAQANGRFFFPVTFNTREKVTAYAPTLGPALQSANHTNTLLQFSHKQARLDAGLAAVVLASGWDLGTAPTWAYRFLRGLETDALTPTEFATLIGNRVQVYVVNKGVSVTWEGKTPSGVYGDFTLFLAWLNARIGEAVFRVLRDIPRVTYTAEDIGKVSDAVWSVLSTARDRKGFSEDFPLTIGQPAPADVDSGDREVRLLGGGGITFTGTFAGAVHNVEVNGTVTL